MDKSNIFSKFPIIEGYKIRLREVTANDIQVLFRLLNDQYIIEEYLQNRRFKDIHQVANTFLFAAEDNFKNQSSIMWAIEDKISSDLIGIREMYFDNHSSQITVQGFMGLEYRDKGYSKEAYKLIIKFARNIGASLILANSNIENYPAIALMYSVGFSHKYVSMTKLGMRVLFIHKLDEFIKPFLSNEAKLRIFIFCKMHIGGREIKIVENGLMRDESGISRKYLVTFIAKNTLGSSFFPGFESEICFVSNGRYIKSIKSDGYIASIESNCFVDAYHYVWKFCKIRNDI